MGREEKIQGIAKSGDITETILFRIVGAIVVHHVRWGKRYYGSRGVGNRGKSLHRRRPVCERGGWAHVDFVCCKDESWEEDIYLGV